MNQPRAEQQAFSEALDRQLILDIKDRFLRTSKERFRRTCLELHPRQQRFLEALPLLFHVNHPALPGFVDRDTPAGISNFKPSELQIKRAKSISRSFRYQPITASARQIHSLFVMGSIGTIGQSRKSDLDFWLCYDPELSEEQVKKLTEKCQKVTRWAETLGLEVCFFPMNADTFRLGKTLTLSEESSGGAQHMLLLDEFYRSGVYIAGRYPLWWFVPPSENGQYNAIVTRIQERRFLRPTETIDLGGIPEIPRQEYLTAGIWQLYKAINSPYKSVLKLALLESYTATYPDTILLSDQFKQAIYNDELDINHLDPYIQIYRQLENYLSSTDDKDRLALIRRCFYFKVHKPLSRPPATNPPSWQRMLLTQLCQEWGWDQPQLKRIDNRRQWKTREVREERSFMVSELFTSYRYLRTFFGELNHSDNSIKKELTILGRKLYAAFENKAGKVELINPDISADISEPTIAFVPLRDGTWALEDQQQQLVTQESLVDTVVWGCKNQVIDHGSRVLTDETTQSLPINPLIKTVLNWLEQQPDKASHAAFKSTAKITASCIITNVTAPQTPQLQLSYSSPRQIIDPLSYGNQQLNLVTDCYLILLNSWGEVFTFSFRGIEGLFNHYLKHCLQTQDLEPPLPEVKSFNPFMNNGIDQRIIKLVEQLHDNLLQSPTQASQVFSLGSRQLLLEADPNSHFYGYQEFESTKSLIDYLSKPRERYTQVHFDPYFLADDLLPLLFSQQQRTAIQVFIKPRQLQCEIYIVDERNALHHYTTEFLDTKTVMRPLHRFLRAIADKKSAQESTGHSHFGVYPIEFYYLQSTSRTAAKALQRLPITPDIRDVSFYNLSVDLTLDSGSYRGIQLHCGQEAFTNENHDSLYREVAQHILSQRRNRERYPCYITDLNIQSEDNVTTLDYLTHKRGIEDKINRALQNL